MNLLESILCTCSAEKYANNFKQFGIDAYTLKLLNDEDLKLVGIVEDEIRTKLLQHSANLQIKAEKQVDVCIDYKYMQLVIYQMSVQLTKHLAAFSIAVNRPDVIICDIRLSPATNCLTECVTSLETQLNEFEQQVIKIKKRRRKSKKFVVATVIIGAVVGWTVYKSLTWIVRK